MAVFSNIDGLDSIDTVDFMSAPIDPRKWDVLIREHSKHNELQYYVPDETTVFPQYHDIDYVRV